MQLALPYHQKMPAHATKFPLVAKIALTIPVELRAPKHDPGFGCSCEAAARMSVPKAAMDEDDATTAREHEIRPSRQALAVKAVSIAKPVDLSADGHLGARVATADARHDFRSAFGGDGVHGLELGPKHRSTVLNVKRDSVANQPGYEDAAFLGHALYDVARARLPLTTFERCPCQPPVSLAAPLPLGQPSRGRPPILRLGTPVWCKPQISLWRSGRAAARHHRVVRPCPGATQLRKQGTRPRRF